jgi:hypothetical protein
MRGGRVLGAMVMAVALAVGGVAAQAATGDGAGCDNSTNCNPIWGFDSTQ